MKKYMLDKNFLKKFLIVASPMILQQFLGASVQLIDNIMVGKLGESAISSVAAVNQIFFIGMLLIFGITGGAGIYTAQYFGAKDFDRLKQSYRLKIICSLLISSSIVLLTFIFNEQLVSIFLDRDGDAFKFALKYLSIAMFGVIPMSINAAIGSTFREISKPILPTISSISAILINTFLNYCLIFGNFGFPELGVAGAALATILARTIETFILLVFVGGYGSVFSTKLKNIFRIEKEVVRKIFKKALPLTLNEGLWSSGMTILFFAYSQRGEIALAGHTVAQTVFQLGFVLFGGVGVAVSVMVGNELGADNIEQAKYNSVKILILSVILGIILSATVFLLSGSIISIYNLSDYAIKVAKYNITTLTLAFPLFIISVTTFFTMRAGGDVKSTLIMDSIFTLLVPVPLALYLAFHTELPIYTMFFLVNCTEILKVIIALNRFSKGRWLNNLTKA